MKNFATTFSKLFSLFAVIAILPSASAFAQLTITSSQFATAFPQIGSSISFNDTGAAGLQPLVNQTGANQTWSFLGLPFVRDTALDNNFTVVAYPGGAPLADSFPEATNVQIESSGGNTYYD